MASSISLPLIEDLRGRFNPPANAAPPNTLKKRGSTYIDERVDGFVKKKPHDSSERRVSDNQSRERRPRYHFRSEASHYY